MDTINKEKQVPKRPTAYTSDAYGRGDAKTEYLDDGRRRVTIYQNGKEVRSYIEDPNEPRPWWKLW